MIEMFSGLWGLILIARPGVLGGKEEIPLLMPLGIERAMNSSSCCCSLPPRLIRLAAGRSNVDFEELSKVEWICIT